MKYTKKPGEELEFHLILYLQNCPFKYSNFSLCVILVTEVDIITYSVNFELTICSTQKLKIFINKAVRFTQEASSNPFLIYYNFIFRVFWSFLFQSWENYWFKTWEELLELHLYHTCVINVTFDIILWIRITFDIVHGKAKCEDGVFKTPYFEKYEMFQPYNPEKNFRHVSGYKLQFICRF